VKTNLTYKEVKEKLAAKSQLVSQIYSEAGEDLDFSKVKCLGEGDTKAKVEKLNQVELEVTDLTADAKEYSEIARKRATADQDAGFTGDNTDMRGSVGQTKAQTKSLGTLFKESEVYKRGLKNVEFHADIDLKSILQTGAGWAPESMRESGYLPYAMKQPKVQALFPTLTTGQDTIKYMEVTTYTNNAAEIAEETNAASPTAYGEAALAMTERSVPVEKVAVWIPVTEEQMEDVAGIEDFINTELRGMVIDKIDSQLVAGNGSTPNLRGVLAASNIQTQAKSTDPTPDAFFKAMTKVRGVTAGTGFGEPTGILIHPNDWQDIRLLRTADGIYIFGNPTDPGPDRLWGVLVTTTPAETENTGVVGDFAGYSRFYIKRGLTIEKTNSHGELFTAGVLAIKATIRCCAVYRRGTAFCTVTGI
jgi:hypothetical protein